MVSIIIPLHNLGSKGDYCLKRCLDSILAQTYADFEVLLMENGSTDDTVEVAKEYCKKDNRFKLHILDTIGIANARNEGLKLADGKYVSFIDGDDAISDNFLNTMMELFQKDTDISYVAAPWSFYYEDSKKYKPVISYNNDKILYTTKQFDYNSAATIWAKIIKRDILINNNIFLDNSLFGYDDFLFSSELYFASKKYALCADACYYYTQNRSNQTTKTRLQNMTEGNLILINRLKVLYNKYNVYEENKSLLKNMYISIYIGADFARTTIRKMNKNQIMQLINRQYDNIISVDINNLQCKPWQKRWFKRFQKSVKYFGAFGGYIFIKYMRFYRNLFIQPLRIKWYK